MSYNSTATNPNLVDPAIVSLANETYEQLVAGPLDYKQFTYDDFQIENINADEYSSMSGLGAGALTLEGQTYGVDYLYDGYTKTLISRKYTKRLPFTEEFQYELRQKSMKAVIKSEKMTDAIMNALVLNWEQDFAKMFYLGAGTTFITGGDGVALISASHPSAKPGLAVQTNIVTAGAVSNPVLNATSLQAAFVQLDRMLDNAGQYMARSTDVALVVPRALEDAALRLKMSTYGPDSANLGLGLMAPQIVAKLGKTFKVLCLNHIPDAYANYWFVIDLGRMKRQVVKAVAWEPTLSPEFQAFDGVKHFMGSTLFGWNPVDWKWILGSTGVNPTA